MGKLRLAAARRAADDSNDSGRSGSAEHWSSAGAKECKERCAAAGIAGHGLPLGTGCEGLSRTADGLRTCDAASQRCEWESAGSEPFWRYGYGGECMAVDR